jgi:putative membrane protein
MRALVRQNLIKERIMKIRPSFALLLAVACFVWPLAVCTQIAVAQNDAGRGQLQTPQLDQNRLVAPQLGDRANAPTASATDAQLAACLIVDNQNEIALSQLALQRAQSDEVKQFAQQMIKDHEQMLSNLQQVAGRSNQSAQAAQGRDQSQAAQLPPDAGQIAQQPGQGTLAQINRQGGNVTSFKLEASTDNSGGLNLVSLKQELGAQCLQSQRRELEQKQGAEFDMCFIGSQVGAHMMVLDELQVFQNHASPEFRSKLTEAQQTVQKHLDHAKQIAKSQMASFQSGSSQKTGSR